MHSPYDGVAPMQRWSSVARDVASGVIEAQGAVRFTIAPEMTIASAGSCFAGRLADHLRDSGSRYLVAERAPQWLSHEKAFAYGYRPFSARYGLVFTSLQLLQLFERAFGRFTPVETHWESDGRFIDPFRPRCAPNGYATLAELLADREQHLAAVRSVFERADVFLFTVGLTECYRDRRDGAVYPYCPGVTGGTFDPALHVFHNLGVRETVESFERFLTALRAINPRIRVLLSVSPVPIGATIEDQHAGRASTYTKSVLRVAVEEIYRSHDFVDYFAAYEMVSQTFFGRDPFTEDRRHLKPGVVDGVMRAFGTHYLASSPQRPMPATSIAEPDVRPCDEDVLAR